MTKERDFYQVSLKLILKNEDGKILIMKGAKGGTYDGYYDLPGGRIDTDEFITPIEDIIDREVKEEIGDIEYSLSKNPVSIGRHPLIKHDKEIHILYVFFVAQYISGDIKISDEHGSFEWIKLSEIEPSKYFKSGLLEGIKGYISPISQ